MKSSLDTEATLERALTDWSIVLYPEIYKHLDSPCPVFTEMDGIHTIAIFGRAKNDLRNNAETGAYADGHRLVTSPITDVKDGKFYTQNSIYTIDENDENAAFKAWRLKRQYTVPPDGWKAKEAQGKMVLRHICESCGKEEILNTEEGFNQGWDYPPKMGMFKVISPRTCGECGVETTLWWELTYNKTPIEELSERHRQTLNRIRTEPESILPELRQKDRDDHER